MTLIVWLNQNNGAVVAAAAVIGVFISAFYAFVTLKLWQETRRQADLTWALWQADRNREHLEAVKNQVLAPLKRRMEALYLPLVRGTLGPVTLNRVQARVGSSISQSGITYEFQLAPRREAGPPAPWPFVVGVQEKEEEPRLNEELYGDAKRHHHSEFLRAVEVFQNSVEGHTARWVKYAEQLSHEIAVRVALPVMRWDSGSQDAEWVNPFALAIYVLEWQLGLRVEQPYLRPERRSIELAGQMVAVARTEGPIQHCRQVLDAVSQDRGRVDELRREAKPLEREGALLLEEIDRLLLASKLPGRCPLAAA